MKKYRLAVSAMVLRPSNVCAPDGCGVVYSMLLVHKPRKNDAWQLPQGGVEEGETLEQAALRELQEETGLRLPAVDYVSPTSYTYDFPPGFVRHFSPVNAGQRLDFVVIELADSLTVTVDNDEIDSFVWILPEELPRYIKRKEYRDVILKVLGEYRVMKGEKRNGEGD